MKAIMISIKPKYVKEILNRKKTIEIRKKFPKDYVGWVYIYCTKDNNALLHKNIADIWWVEDKEFRAKSKRLGIKQQPSYNGKVVARFWCDKVEELMFLEGLYDPLDRGYCTDTLDNAQVEIKSCVPQEKIIYYLYSKGKGYAIHITKLEIFDKPKEIGEFKPHCNYPTNRRLTRAPQSWCYVEV